MPLQVFQNPKFLFFPLSKSNIKFEKEMSDNENMNVKKIYNDMIDEEIDLDEPEDVGQEPQAIKNQPVDEVHEISDDSGEMHVPSPEDSQSITSFKFLNL
jgi:hypothetical protein